MPIYEYRCEKGHTFEALQRMSEDPLTSCETCAAPATRVLHAPAVHFKGSGFYNTDYGTRKRAREKSASESKTSEGGGESSSTSTSTSEGDGGVGAKKPEKSAKAGSAS